MKCYNIYNKNVRVNTKPLSRADLDKILEQKTIKKVVDGAVIEYRVDALRIVKCIVQ